jgi:hypothetical protein
MRRWAQGDHVQGLPVRRFAIERVLSGGGKPAAGSKMTSKKFRKPRYKISAAGDDVLIQFGKHAGNMLSVIAANDPSYLDWIIREDFPDDLKDVARHLKGRLGR